MTLTPCGNRPLASDAPAAPHSASGETVATHDLGPVAPPPRPARRWTPKRVVATPAAYDHAHGLRIMALVEAQGIEVERCRPVTTRVEGGTSPLDDRLGALRRLALDGYPVGLTIAPIIAVPDWPVHYGELLGSVAAAVGDVPGLHLTAELITHRFSPGSKEVLLGWYPRTKLEMDEAARSRKHGKFGAVKYVYPPDTMAELRTWFHRGIAERLPACRVLYWT